MPLRRTGTTTSRKEHTFLSCKVCNVADEFAKAQQGPTEEQQKGRWNE